MSWWTKLRDATESVLSTATPFDVRSDSARRQRSGVTGAANKVRNYEEGAFNAITGRQSAADRREQDRLVNDQIKAYQDQTALARQQLDEARAATAAEKRRVEEKQIRALRRNYRSASVGLLGVGSPASQDMTSKLGG